LYAPKFVSLPLKYRNHGGDITKGGKWLGICGCGHFVNKDKLGLIGLIFSSFSYKYFLNKKIYRDTRDY